jgi:lysophospholipid acyltransferase (LPLAT)-like uncharacterized protein
MFTPLAAGFCPGATCGEHSLYTSFVPFNTTPKLRLSQRITLAIVPWIAALVIRLLGLTLRYEDRAEPGGTPGYDIPGPVVFAFWHRSLLACAYRFRGLDIAILISPSFDGELIARTVERLGFRAIRGSSSRGGAAGLRNMLAAYNEGHRCAFTADGPRGPMFVAKPGAAQLANSVGGPGQATGTWVGCFYALPDRAWELRSWDRFMIPKPFSRVVLTWPAHIPAGQVTTETVQAALDRAVAMAAVLSE